MEGMMVQNWSKRLEMQPSKRTSPSDSETRRRPEGQNGSIQCLLKDNIGKQTYCLELYVPLSCR
jgi:hypothetical protein